MKSLLTSVHELTRRQRDEMFARLDAHFEGVTSAGFDADLENKQYALLILDASNAVVGFSTIGLWDTWDDEKPITVLVSGDTIVAPEAWKHASFPRAWLAALAQIRARASGRMMWLLLTSGYRTYRLLPALAREFYPRLGCETPPTMQRLLDRLAEERFGPQYISKLGIVRFEHPQVLRPHLRGVPETRLRDSDVSAFLAMNPGHEQGDELVCLADLDDSNLTPHALRLIRRLEA